jgi:hypothetical protein
VVPNIVEVGRQGDRPVLVRSRAFLDRPRLDVTQGGRLLASHRLRRMIPNRSHRIPSRWQRLVAAGEDVLISVS